MTKQIGVDPEKIFGLQTDFHSKVRVAFKNNDVQFFAALEAFLKSNYKQKYDLIRNVGVELDGSFIVEEIISGKSTDKCSSNFTEKFKKDVWEPSRNREISINSYTLIEEHLMNDSFSIQDLLNPIMEEDTFWALICLLLVNPDLGKKILNFCLGKDRGYTFIVRLVSGNLYAIRVSFRVRIWTFQANDYIQGIPLDLDDHFLITPIQ